MAPLSQYTPAPNKPDTALHLFKPAEEPKYPSAIAAAVEGADEAFKGIGTLNKAAEDAATDTGRKAGEEIQSDYGSSVQRLYENAFPNKSDDTLTPAKADAAPQPVKDGISSAANIRAARDQGGLPGHIRETEYYKQLYMKASQLRSQWPGYRDYIDKGFEKATGITPNANQYIKSMLADLNEAYAKKDTDKNKAISEVWSLKEFQGQPEMLEGLMNGSKTPVDAAKWANSVTGFKADYERNKASLTGIELGDKRGELASRASVNAFVGGESNATIDGLRTKFKLTDENLKDWAANPDKYTPDQVDQMRAHLSLEEAKIDQKVSAKFASKPGQLGEREFLKNDFQKYVDEAKAPIKAWKEALASKDYTMLDRYKHLDDALGHRDYYNVYKGTNGTAMAYRRAGVAKQFGAGVIQPIDLIPDKDELDQMLGGAASGTNPPTVKNMNDAVSLIDKENGGNSPKSVWSYVRGIGMGISSPESQLTNEQKSNLIEHAFKQTDQNWLTSLAARTYDVARGIPTVGREDVFKQFTDPTFRDNVKNIAAQTHNPKLLEHYNNWVENSFYQITKDTLNKLPALGEVRNMVIKYHESNKADTPSKFEILPGGNDPRTFTSYLHPTGRHVAGQQYYGQYPYNKSELGVEIGKLNDAIASLHNVQGLNANTKLMQIMANAGVDFSKNPTDAAYQVFNAVKNSKAPVEGSKKPQGRVE